MCVQGDTTSPFLPTASARVALFKGNGQANRKNLSNINHFKVNKTNLKNGVGHLTDFHFFKVFCHPTDPKVMRGPHAACWKSWPRWRRTGAPIGRGRPAGSSAGREAPRRHARAAGPLAFPSRPRRDLSSLCTPLQSGRCNGGNEFKSRDARGKSPGVLNIRKDGHSIMLHTSGFESHISGQRP